jgi:alkaline phosphatase D
MGQLGSGGLTNMVALGQVTDRTVRVWFRSEDAGAHTVSITDGAGSEVLSQAVTVPPNNATDNTAAITCGGPDGPLRPLTRYTYKVTRQQDGAVLGGGRFETAPALPADTPPVFSIGVTSCHQPYDDEGQLSDRRQRLLNVAQDVFSNHDAKFVIACGDQLYADAPEQFSLFDDHYFGTDVLGRPAGENILRQPADVVRRAYQQRYRQMWDLTRLRKLYADYPTYPILDDHEIRDDWGSLAGDTQLGNLAEGARAAYMDYQGLRVTDRTAALLPSFHYSFTYGHTAAFVLDIRSQRRVGGAGEGNTLYGPEQFADLERFLADQADKKVVLIVVSVPIIYLPGFLADIGHAITGPGVDFLDQWSHARNVSARDALLRLLHNHQQAHPEQKVAFVSGDVHTGCAFEIAWKGGQKPRTFQFTSSPISNKLCRFQAHLSSLGASLSEFSTLRCAGGPEARLSLLRGVDGADQNPFTGLNMGIIEVRTQADGSVNLRWKLMSYETKPSLVAAPKFISGWP